MNNIIAWFFKVSNIRLIVAMCALYLIFPLYLLPNIINTGTVGPLDLLFWYNQETLYQMLTDYGEAIRYRYIIGLLTVDLAYPIFYGTFLVIIMALIIKKFTLPFSQKIIFIPYIVVFFDLIENSILVFLLSTYPIKHTVIANIAGVVTAAKWSAFVLIVIFLLYLVIYGIRSRKSISR
ncbi:MAG: hypothetical protein ACI8QG_002471 [Flavobacteriales bacterium]|jgi:hypothetical protein